MGESVSITKENKTYQKIFTVSSLDKVFPKEGPNLLQNEYTIFKNETFHFQVSFYFTHITNVKIFVRSDLEKYITVRSVESIPARFARYEGVNDDYVINGHGNNDLYPELLRPLYKTHETMRHHDCFGGISLGYDRSCRRGEIVRLYDRSFGSRTTEITRFHLYFVDALRLYLRQARSRTVYV